MNAQVLEVINSRPKNLDAVVAKVEGLSPTAARKALKEAVDAGQIQARGKGAETVYFIPGQRTPLEKGRYSIEISHVKGSSVWAVKAKAVGAKGEPLAVTDAPSSQAAVRRIKKLMGLEGQSDAQKHFDNDWRAVLATVEE